MDKYPALTEKHVSVLAAKGVPVTQALREAAQLCLEEWCLVKLVFNSSVYSLNPQTILERCMESSYTKSKSE